MTVVSTPGKLIKKIRRGNSSLKRKLRYTTTHTASLPKSTKILEK